MSNTFHTVFNKELEGVSVFVHVEVASINLGNDMLDIKCSIEFGLFFQLKNDFLQVVVRRKDSNYANWD